MTRLHWLDDAWYICFNWPCMYFFIISLAVGWDQAQRTLLRMMRELNELQENQTPWFCCKTSGRSIVSGMMLWSTYLRPGIADFYSLLTDWTEHLGPVLRLLTSVSSQALLLNSHLQELDLGRAACMVCTYLDEKTCIFCCTHDVCTYICMLLWVLMLLNAPVSHSGTSLKSVRLQDFASQCI